MEFNVHNLRLVWQDNSGIPLLKSDITSQIKSYRLNLEHEKELLGQVQDFDHLHVQEPIIPLPDQSAPVPDQEPNLVSEETLVLSTTVLHLWNNNEAHTLISEVCYSAVFHLVPLLLNKKIF